MIFGIPRSALVFSTKSFLAGMLALYVALLTGLENPAWSVVTAYIVAQPHAGAALSKAGYRLVGTFIGAWAAILMVPPLVHAPALLGLSIAAWLGACVFASLADRSPRGYLFALAGYTTCIVAYPVLSHPQDVFQQGMSRFEEIALGIVCSAMVHAIVFPVSTASVLHKRLETVLRDARQACIEALSPSPSARSGADRRKLATAIGELHELLLHQRFEGRHVGTQEQLVRPLLPRLERLIPLSLAVGDRLDELARLDRLDPALLQFLERARQWFDLDAPARQPAEMADLLRQCNDLQPAPDHALGWGDALRLNLLERIGTMLRQHAGIEQAQAAPGSTQVFEDSADAAAMRALRPLDRDVRGATGAGLSTALTVLAGNALWIASGWPGGSGAAMMCGVYFAVYSGTPNPSQMLKNKFTGVVWRLLLGAVYVAAIIPALSGFEALAAALAPALLVSGVMMGMPRYSALGFNLVLGLFSPTIVDRSFHADFAGYLNAGLATLVGVYFAMMMVSATRFLWIDGMCKRIIAAGRKDIASLRFVANADQSRWNTRMVHRMGLLVQRAAAGEAHTQAALQDMMTGTALAQLHAAGEDTPGAATAQQAIIREVSAHYRQLPDFPDAVPSPALQAQIDHCLAQAAANPSASRAGLLALTSLRRNLFPDDHAIPHAMS